MWASLGRGADDAVPAEGTCPAGDIALGNRKPVFPDRSQIGRKHVSNPIFQNTSQKLEAIEIEVPRVVRHATASLYDMC